MVAVRCAMRIVVWLLVAIWLPASSHPLLEHAGLIHQQHEGHPDLEGEHGHIHPATSLVWGGVPGTSGETHEHGAGNHAAADGHCLRAAGDVQAQVPVVAGCFDARQFSLRWAVTVALAGRAGRSAGWLPPGLAPPEMQCRWQFSLRAVRSARAPSIVS